LPAPRLYERRILLLHTLSFYGTVSASSRVTLTSKRLAFPYIINHIRVKFALGQNGLVQHKFFVSDDKASPSSGEPSGVNILEQWGSVDYVVGDDDILEMDDNTYIDRMNTWIKVLAINADTFDHHANVVIIIDDLREHPAEKRLRALLGPLLKKDSKGE